MKRVSGLFLAMMLGVVLALTGCDKKEAPQADAPKNEASQEIIRQVQEPQQRVRDMEQQLLERDREQREAADRASR